MHQVKTKTAENCYTRKQSTAVLTWDRALVENKSILQKICILFGAVALYFCAPAKAEAIPGLNDHWHFFCSPSSKVSTKFLAKMKVKSESGGVKGAVAKLNYACLLHLYEVNKHEATIEKWQTAGGKGAQPQLNHQMSLGVLKQAVATLASLNKGKKKDPTALYYYGYALAIAGDVETVNRLDELMTEFPTAKQTADAPLVLGEFYFDNKDPQKAFREYATALKSKNQLVKLYTRYKQSWINYAVGVDSKDQNKKKKAITDLVAVSKAAEAKKGKLYKKLSEIIKVDLMALLADFGNLDEARRILSAIGAKDVYAKLVEQMAYARLNAGDPKGAYSLFQIAAKEDPLRPEAPAISTNLVRLAGQMNDVGLVAANLKLMVKTYMVDKKWRSIQKAPLHKKSDADLEALLYEFSTIIDRQGRETANPQFLASAQQLYELFIKTFPKSTKIVELQYYIAQIQVQNKQYLKGASLLYTLLKNNPKFPQAKEASEMMVTAAQVVIDNDKTAYKVEEPGTPLSPQKIPTNRKIYSECLELFLKFQPKNPMAPTMDFTVASIYYDYGHFDKAIKSYNMYIRRFPTGEFAKPAAARVLLYHQRQFDDEGLEKAKANFLAMPAFRADPEMMATIKAMSSIDKKGKDSKVAGKKTKKVKKAKEAEAEEEAEEEAEDVVSENEEADEAIEASSPEEESSEE